ncbi:phosphatase PAP2 family protein [Micromonospora sp. KC721]|uniref:phosphatase PAP2 family protein n=1 Tax=Micromonospora sp. KC721 TaxID=2530380 RepID=UPI001044F6CC|nr:hypothetical protein [Micromonospora sp. KC721]TDB81465.1 hypothetical protein E1182_05005 [Micromonospora sp. KC721]
MPAQTTVVAPIRSGPARVVTEVFAPAVWAALMPLVVAVHATAPALSAGLGWGLLAVLFNSAVPYAVILWQVRRGRLTDHHIGRREQRRKPLLFGLTSVLAGLAVLVALGAPRPLVAMVVVMFAVLLVVTAVNQVWKLSAHAAVSAGSVSVLVILFGPALLTLAGLVALIGWSRVRLGDHTTAQVLAGTTAGVLVAAPTFLLLG